MKRLILAILLIFLAICSLKAQDSKTAIPFNDDSVLLPDKYGIYSECEHQPTFPGGTKAFQKYLLKNLKWPDKTGMIDVQGKVRVSFVVEKDGTLTNFKVLRKLHPLFDAEAIKVLKKSPRWNPGTVNGHKVRARYLVPINFQLPN
ncbi:MAG TPA: energy transducer TonB [Mucilaginibacter sp.]|nr:energy transducer TonB [Mucilaginibacter sp.]